MQLCDEFTTLSLEGIPNGLSYEGAACLVGLLAGYVSFNFLYLPVQTGSFASERMLIVNFVSPDVAKNAFDQASQLSRISVSWYHTQGLIPNINLFRQSSSCDLPTELCAHVYDMSTLMPVLPPSPCQEKRRGPISNVKVFVGGLQTSTDTKSLRAYFSQFGKIEDCAVVRDFSGLSRKFGFCKFATSEAAIACLSAASHEIDGSRAGVRAYTAKQI